MFRERALSVTFFVLILTSLACNAFAGSLQPLPPPPTAVSDEVASETPADPAATVTLPSSSQLATSSVTILVDLNVRSGPGVKYDRIGFLLKNESVPVIGIHSGTGWWKIVCPADVSGSECWVSGGEQYTRAAEAGSVAEVEAPPTLTPIPPTLEQGIGILAFIDNGTIYASKLDITQNPPQPAGEPVQLTNLVNVQSLAISPDGRRIAFTSGSSEANNLHVVNTDGQDLRTLAISTEIPLAFSQNDTDLAVLVNQFEWLPDSTQVAFNTAVINLVGPGIQSQEDLWNVTMDGELSQPFPAGQGGGAFVLAADDKVLLSRSDNIASGNMDGSKIETILQFDLINTASEYIFYPIPQQIDNGEMVVYIPDAQPWQPGALTTTWLIPVTGATVQFGSIEGNALFDPILWSSSGSRLAFVQHPGDPDTAPLSTIMIADGNGIDANPYASGDGLVLHDWGFDNETFLYSGDGFYAVGNVDAETIQSLLSPGQRVNDAQWITENSFAAAVGFPENGSWDLISAGVSGEYITLWNIRGHSAIFDIWRP